MRVFNAKSLLPLRRVLRRTMPEPEMLVWRGLRARQLHEYKFRRQQSIGLYIVDFYCPQAKLIVEIDGDSHDWGDTPKRDVVRQQFLEARGLHLLRYTNADVMRNLDAVLADIVAHLP